MKCVLRCSFYLRATPTQAVGGRISRERSGGNGNLVHCDLAIAEVDDLIIAHHGHIEYTWGFRCGGRGTRC
eukprot:7862963-Alexandrium_andersonii.AAC.1